MDEIISAKSVAVRPELENVRALMLSFRLNHGRCMETIRDATIELNLSMELTMMSAPA